MKPITINKIEKFCDMLSFCWIIIINIIVFVLIISLFFINWILSPIAILLFIVFYQLLSAPTKILWSNLRS